MLWSFIVVIVELGIVRVYYRIYTEVFSLAGGSGVLWWIRSTILLQQVAKRDLASPSDLDLTHDAFLPLHGFVL